MKAEGLVQRTIWILRAVAAHPEGIGLSDVAREAGIPKATCYRVLSVLEKEQWLLLDPDTRRYRVSLGLLSIVGGLLDKAGGYAHMQQVIRELAEQAGESAGFDVLLPPNVMVLAQKAGPHLIGQTLRPVPRTQPVWITASGRSLLAWTDPVRIRAEFGEDFPAGGVGRHRTLDDYLAALADIREAGYSYAYDELEPGAASVAAPVWVRGSVEYAVWVGGPTFRITRDRIEPLGQLVKDAAQRLGNLLSVTDGLPPTAAMLQGT